MGKEAVRGPCPKAGGKGSALNFPTLFIPNFHFTLLLALSVLSWDPEG